MGSTECRGLGEGTLGGDFRQTPDQKLLPQDLPLEVRLPVEGPQSR